MGFTCSVCTDEDRWRQLDPDWHNVSDTVTYTWTKTGGSWKNGASTGRTVTWIAPATAGTYTITVTVDDEDNCGGGGCGGDICGSDNDDPKDKSLDILVIDGLTVVPGTAYVCVNGTKDFQAWACVEGSIEEVTEDATFSTSKGSMGPGGGPGNNTLTASSTPSGSEGADWVRATYNDTTTDADHDCHLTVIKVKIKQGGDDITDTTHDEIVGKQINLAGEVEPSGLAMSTREWCIPGFRIKNYEANNQVGDVTALTEEDLDEASVAFYWVDGGDGRKVEYTLLVEGITCNGKATFDVKRPTSTMTTTTSSVSINEGPGQYYYALRFGDASTAPVTNGIEFNCSVNIPEGFNGATAFAQLYSWNRRLRSSSWPYRWQHLQGSGLDHSFPYGSGTYCDDSPTQGLLEDSKRAEVDETATMWFIFKPSISGAIWVPLRKVSWWWKGTADRVQDNQWELDSGDNSDNPASVDTTQHPEWTHNIADDEWEWE